MSLFIWTPIQLKDGQKVKGYYLSEKGKNEFKRLINEQFNLREIIMKLETTQSCYYPLLNRDRVYAYLRNRIIWNLTIKSMREWKILNLFPRIFWNDAEKMLKVMLSERKIQRTRNGWYKTNKEV